jgi:hypothetical protein
MGEAFDRACMYTYEMTVRERETFEPVTRGHIRGHGCPRSARLLRLDPRYHETKMNADHLPDETPDPAPRRPDSLLTLWQPWRRRAAGLVTTYEPPSGGRILKLLTRDAGHARDIARLAPLMRGI